MRQQAPEAEYSVCPRGRPALRSLLWSSWGLGMVGGLLAGLCLVLTQITLPSHREFAGVLQPARGPVALQLPAGVQLERILVERGEEVAAGQTLVTLDTATMEARLAEIKREIAADSLLRACILGAESEHAPDTWGDTGTGGDTETRALLTIARLDCATRQEARAAGEARIAVERSILDERRDLLEDYLIVSARNTVASTPTPESIRKTLALAISRNLIDRMIAELDNDADAARTDRRQAAITKVRALSDRIAQNLRQGAVLIRYLQAPRLLAPDAGRINRIRPVQAGLSLGDTVEIIEIVPDDSPSFIARFDIPEPDAATLDQGMQVRMSLLGGWHRTPLLSGEITSFSGVRDGMVTAEVRLSAQSAADLSDPDDGVALRGRNTASRLRVKLDDYRMDEELLRNLDRLAPGIRVRIWSVIQRLQPVRKGLPPRDPAI